MCSVVGYVGNQLSRSFILKGLSRLEYRGYDSAGFACLDPETLGIKAVKAKGQLENLIKEFEHNAIDGYISIGQTRWATHGTVSTENAHPHFDCSMTLSVVHNGIIENYHALQQELSQQGHIFKSQTDTEVIIHLLEHYLAEGKSLKDAVVSLVNVLEGSYAFACIGKSFPNTMIVVRKGAVPLCIGVGKGETFIASDLTAFIDITNNVIFLDDENFALIDQSTIRLFDFKGNEIAPRAKQVPVSWTGDGKNGYEHYMLKEIYEQKNAIYSTISSLQSLEHAVWDQLGLGVEKACALNSLTLIGCGSSWHAARIAQFYFEQICGLPTRVMLASEFRYMPLFQESQSAYIAISQSGETADTLEVLRLIKKQHSAPTIALTNVASSAMVREAGGFFLTHAGFEVSVASTKAFSTQLAALFWFAHKLAALKDIIDERDVERSFDDLVVAAEILEHSIDRYKEEIVHEHAPRYAQFKKFIFLGRHISYPFAMESALKLKEISYLFAQCYPAGELKHGPIALIDDETPVVIFSNLDPIIYQKLLSNAQEVKARNGHLIVFAFEGQHELCSLADCLFVIPKVHSLLGPLATTGLMQFFVYSIAKTLGRPIDKPRHLAKSVTVE